MRDIADYLPRHQQVEPLVITGASVITMARRGEVLERHTVRVEDGVLTAIGPDGSVAMDGTVIEADGRFLTPGLADMHTHVTEPEYLLSYLANGVTTLRHMWGNPGMLAYSRRRDSGELALPRLRTTSPVIDGVGPTGAALHDGSAVVSDPRDAKEVAVRYARRGYPMLKLYSQLSADAMHALGEAALDAGIEVGGHCPNNVTFEDAMAAGYRCFEHLMMIEQGHCRPGLKPEEGYFTAKVLTAFAEAVDEDKIRLLARDMASRGVWNCPTLVVISRLAHAPSGAADEPTFAYADPLMRGMWPMVGAFVLTDPQTGETTPPEEWLAAHRRYTTTLRRITGILHEEGAPLLVGTDAPNPYVVPGFSIHDELRLFVEAGMTPEEALRCATAEAARFLRESDTFGTVEVGKAADLLLLRGNPLQDIGAMAELDLVVSAGVHFDCDAVQALLTDAQEGLHATSLPEPLDHGGRVWAVTEGGQTLGRVEFTHDVREDGTVEVVEHCRVATEGSRRSRLHLSGAGRLLGGQVVVRSPYGATTMDIDPEGDSGRLRVRLVGDDGYSVETAVPADIVPAPALCLSAVPLIEQAIGAVEDGIAVLRLDLGETACSTATMRFVVDDAEGALMVVGEIDRSGQPKRWVTLRDPEGTVNGVSGPGWVQPREFSS